MRPSLRLLSILLLLTGCVGGDNTIDYGAHPDGRRYVKHLGSSWKESKRLKVVNNFVYVTFDTALVVSYQNKVIESLSRDYVYLVGVTAEGDKVAFMVGQTDPGRGTMDTFLASRSYAVLDKKSFARALVGGASLDNLNEVKRYVKNGKTYRVWITALENLSANWDDEHYGHLHLKGLAYRKDLTNQEDGFEAMEERTFHPVD